MYKPNLNESIIPLSSDSCTDNFNVVKMLWAEARENAKNNGDSVIPIPCGKDELETYLDESLESHDTTDILSWWKGKETRFPNLSKMARDYLAIPGSSVSKEVMFSQGADHITKFSN